jgi:hypothetical protein
MGCPEVEASFTHLAVDRNVSSSTQSIALNAVAFLYNKFLDRPVGDIGQFSRSKSQSKLPVIFIKKRSPPQRAGCQKNSPGANFRASPAGVRRRDASNNAAHRRKRAGSSTDPQRNPPFNSNGCSPSASGMVSVGLTAEIGLKGRSSRERFRRRGHNSARFHNDQDEKRGERLFNTRGF